MLMQIICFSATEVARLVAVFAAASLCSFLVMSTYGLALHPIRAGKSPQRPDT